MTLTNLFVTTTLLTSGPNPWVPGLPVTLTAVVSASAAGTPAGSVRFTVDGVAQPPVPLTMVNGRARAVFTTAGLGLGTHTVTAAYGGNPAFAPGLSNRVTQVINPAPVLVSLQRIGTHAQPTRLVLTFNRPMNAA